MGEVNDIVNTGVTVLHLLANHGNVQTVQGGYANGFPIGYDGTGASGGSFVQIEKHWKQSSEWYEITKVDFDFTVGVSWLAEISHGSSGKYIDQVTVTLDVKYIPIDFDVDVQANFPTHGNNLGTPQDPVAALPFTLAISFNGVFGQALAWRQQKDVLVRGDKNYEWPT